MTTPLPERDIKIALEAGLENTRDLLSENDARYGKTTKKNKMYAECLEDDIDNIKRILNLYPSDELEVEL